MSKVCMLTTIDNPYDPFDQFDEWSAYDEQKGYHSSSLLARSCVTIRSLGESVYQEQIENAIDEIVSNDFTQLYKKVCKDL